MTNVKKNGKNYSDCLIDILFFRIPFPVPKISNLQLSVRIGYS
jgi:hypothetical protein